MPCTKNSAGGTMMNQFSLTKKAESLFTITPERTMKKLFTPEAEILNARLAMIGFVAGVGAYIMTGQLIPGIW